MPNPIPQNLHDPRKVAIRGATFHIDHEKVDEEALAHFNLNVGRGWLKPFPHCRLSFAQTVMGTWAAHVWTNLN